MKTIRLSLFLLLLNFIFSACEKKGIDLPPYDSSIPTENPAKGSVYFTFAKEMNEFMYPIGKINDSYLFTEDQLIVPISVSWEGPKEIKKFRVSIEIDDAFSKEKIHELGASLDEVFPAPKDAYTIPDSLNIDKKETTFNLVFDGEKIRQVFSEKVLVVSMKLKDPSIYEIDESYSTLSVIVEYRNLDDENVEETGERVNITKQYIKNPGNPFEADINASNDRRGNLKDWNVTENVKNTGDGYGGWDNFLGGGFMAMDAYGNPPIKNGKIWQTIHLPRGVYELSADFHDFGLNDDQSTNFPAFIIAVEGQTLPDYSDVDTSLGKSGFMIAEDGERKAVFKFVVTKEQDITIGIVANIIEERSWFRLREWHLFSL